MGSHFLATRFLGHFRLFKSGYMQGKQKPKSDEVCSVTQQMATFQEPCRQVFFNSPLFYDQIILYSYNACDTFGDFPRFINSRLRINEAAQLNDAFACFYTDLK